MFTKGMRILVLHETIESLLYVLIESFYNLHLTPKHYMQSHPCNLSYRLRRLK